MARARSIKPGFFRDRKLLSLPPLARILFAGLWTVADRDGRLVDDSEQIRLDVLPSDRCNIEKLLQALSDAKFIVRYEDESNRYIQIRTWGKHQNPHMKEPASTIPAPVLPSASSGISGAKIPSSLNPVTDSLNPELVLGARTPTAIALLDDFPAFLEAATACELLPASETDVQQARFEWRNLDPDQKRAALTGLRTRQAAGEFSDPAFRPLPQNYLKKRLWQRPIRASPRGAPSKSDRAMEIFMENMADKFAREQPR